MALGAGAAVASGAHAASAATAAAHSAAATKTAGLATAGASASAGVLKLAVAKAVLVGALCGVATLGGAHYIQTSSSKPDTVAPAGVAPLAEKQRPRSSGEVAPAGAPDMPPAALDPSEARSTQGSAASPAPVSPIVRAEQERTSDRTAPSPGQLEAPAGESPAPPQPAVVAPGASAPLADVASLSGEIRIIDAARAWLLAADPRRALRELDRYAIEFPNGKLAEEATVLRIEVLAKLGDMSGAERLADQFVRTHPRSGHLAKIRAILSKGSRE
jgi:hypothetical protein